MARADVRASPAVRFGQDGARRIRAGARRARRRACCRPAAPRARSPSAGLAVTDVGTLHRLPGDARRPREDAASQGARAASSRAATCRRTRRRCASTASRPSTSSWSTSIRSARPSRKPGCTLEDAIENIDIGGPSMVRAAAKNWPHVGVVVDPADYPAMLAELARAAARCRDATRFRLMRKAFAHTASYDGAIANWLTARDADGDAQRAGPTRSTSPASRCRTCATARTRTSPPRSIATSRRRAGTHRDVPAAAGQGAVVQQRRRQRRRVGVREDVRRARLRDRQARQSLRRRAWRDAARGLSQGVRHRSRRRRSAASSRSIGRSTPRRSKRSPAQFLEC